MPKSIWVHDPSNSTVKLISGGVQQGLIASGTPDPLAAISPSLILYMPLDETNKALATVGNMSGNVYYRRASPTTSNPASLAYTTDQNGVANGATTFDNSNTGSPDTLSEGLIFDAAQMETILAAGMGAGQAEGTYTLWFAAAIAGEWTAGSQGRLIQISQDMNGGTNFTNVTLTGSTSQMTYVHRSADSGVTAETITGPGGTGWHQMGISFSTVADECKYYLDGAQVGATRLYSAKEGEVAQNSSALAVEDAFGPGASTGFYGHLSDFRAFSRPLTADEMAVVYAQGY